MSHARWTSAECLGNMTARMQGLKAVIDPEKIFEAKRLQHLIKKKIYNFFCSVE